MTEDKKSFGEEMTLCFKEQTFGETKNSAGKRDVEVRSFPECLLSLYCSHHPMHTELLGHNLVLSLESLI